MIILLNYAEALSFTLQQSRAPVAFKENGETGASRNSRFIGRVATLWDRPCNDGLSPPLAAGPLPFPGPSCCRRDF